MGNEKKGVEWDCKYNCGVICDFRTKCRVCGWNPVISDRRKEKIRAERAQMLAEVKTC